MDVSTKAILSLLVSSSFLGACARSEDPRTQSSESVSVRQSLTTLEDDECNPPAEAVPKRPQEPIGSVTHFGYKGDPDWDSYSGVGIGAFSQKDVELRKNYVREHDDANLKGWDAGKNPKYYIQDTLLRQGDLALSPDLASQATPRASVTVKISHTPEGGGKAEIRCFSGRFMDKTAADLDGRVDVFDPNKTAPYIGDPVLKLIK